ncbi:MAG: hypothetical protein ACYS1A_17320 [Planctomycetota bacterium]|jgi:hypothetical protein
MKVKITDEYYLTSDAHNIILNQVFTVQEGKNRGSEYLKPVGFYPGIVQAFEGLLRLKGMRSKARTLEGLIREHSELIGIIKKAFPTAREVLHNEA